MGFEGIGTGGDVAERRLQDSLAVVIEAEAVQRAAERTVEVQELVLTRVNSFPARDTARAMSESEPEIVSRLRRTYDAFSRGNFDRALEIAHPDIEFIPPGGQAPLRGSEAFRAWMEPDAMEEQRIEPREIRLNGDKVLIHHHAWARGAASGIELEADAWVVWTVDEDGLVTRVEAFLDHEKSQALEAAGLSE